jgi:endonuclease/exonuclease/phosphatase family metal-dependent hydrolase
MIGHSAWNRLHVMSFNIQGGTASRTASPTPWSERRKGLVELLCREVPALIGLQEAQHDQLVDLEKALPTHRVIGNGRRGGSHDEYSAILYDAARLELLAWDQFWLSDSPHEIGSTSWGGSQPRIVTWARFEDKNTRSEFVHLNTQFDDSSHESRYRSAQALVAFLDSEELRGLPVVLTGDFSADADASGVHRILAEDGPLADTWDRAENRLSPAPRGERRDWVLASRSFRIRRVGFNAWRPADGKAPSGHQPVQAVIALG